jgi:hypothetical protein
MQRLGWKPRITAAGLLCAGFLVVVGPWLQRNHSVHGVPAITVSMGESLVDRLHRYDPAFDFHDSADNRSESERSRIRRRVFELAQTHTRGFEIRGIVQQEFRVNQATVDSVFLEAGLQVIKQEPSRYLTGTLVNILHLAAYSDPSLDRLWQMRFQLPYERSWPAPVRHSLEANTLTAERQSRAA